MPTDTFRLLLASDLHVGEVPNRVGLLEVPQCIDPFNVRFMSSHSQVLLDGLADLACSPDYDALVVAGDLTSTGSDGDFQAVRRWLDDVEARSDKPVIIPGNHDRYHGPGYLPGSTRFEKHLDSYWRPGQAVQVVADLELGRSRLVLIGVDCTLSSVQDAEPFPLSHLGQGCVRTEHVEALRRVHQEVTRDGADNVVVGLVVHYPPLYPGGGRSLKLVNETALVTAMFELVIPFAMCGHTHQAMCYRIDGAIGVICNGTSTQRVGPRFEGHTVHEVSVSVHHDNRSPDVTMCELAWCEDHATFR